MAKNKNVTTINDVASEAGVAKSTVSLVMNNQNHVRECTKQKVLEAAHKLGYGRNSIAASMKTGHTKIIVAIVPDFINDFFTSVTHEIHEVVAERGYFTLVFATNESSEKEKELSKGKIGRIIDGAILISSVDDEGCYSGLPNQVVLVDKTIGAIDSVVIDNFKGAYLATKELFDFGHTKIAAINGGHDFVIYINRKKVFEPAMSESGIPIQERYIKHGAWYQESGYALTGELV